MAIKKRKNPESPNGDKVKFNYLVINGTRYRTLLNKKFINRKKWEYPDLSKVYTYIPGTIIDVLVKEGDVISENDPLIILEAMKMRNVITSHAGGKIAKLNVKEGERIPKGHLIIQMEIVE